MSLTFRPILVTVLCASAMHLFAPIQSGAEEGNHLVRVRLLGEGPTAARVSVIGADGKPRAPKDAAIRKTKRGQTYFYAAQSFALELPAGATRFQFAGGLEVYPQTVRLRSDSPTTIDVRQRPWVDMASRGWFSGDSHVHLHTGGPLAVTTADALVAARAEGVHYVNLCVSNNVGDDIRDADQITGKPHPMSTKRHLLVFGEEMRSSIYGHMQFFGIRKLIEPQYTGFDNTPNHNDYPANYTMAAEAIRQGGIVTYGHPMFAGQPLPFGDDPTAGNAAARELPIDAVLGAAQAIDLMSYNSDEDLSAELWYRLLNCGLKLSACVGTDALLDRSTDPLGGSRVYVKVDGPLTMQAWHQGLRDGRTFVTNGPIPQLTVAGKGPGETRKLKQPGKVRVAATVESLVPFDRVEVLLNGKVVHQVKSEATATASEPNAIRLRKLDLELPIERSSWIALRVRGPDHPSIFDGPAWAHTSPVFIRVADKPISSPKDAAYFVDWIDRLLRVVATRDRYPTPEARGKVESLFRKAQAEFRRLAKM